MNIVDKAIIFAATAHAGQRRKYTGEPYIAHPIEVMQIVNSVEHNDAMLAAAVLHDVVEDTRFTTQDILFEFGAEVGSLVNELTDLYTHPDMGNRARRKSLERERLSAISEEGQTIKIADLISNTKSIVAHDPGFAKVYLSEKRELLNVMTGGNPTLREIAIMQIGETE